MTSTRRLTLASAQRQGIPSDDSTSSSSSSSSDDEVGEKATVSAIGKAAARNKASTSVKTAKAKTNKISPKQVSPTFLVPTGTQTGSSGKAKAKVGKSANPNITTPSPTTNIITNKSPIGTSIGSKPAPLGNVYAFVTHGSNVKIGSNFPKSQSGNIFLNQIFLNKTKDGNSVETGIDMNVPKAGNAVKLNLAAVSKANPNLANLPVGSKVNPNLPLIIKPKANRNLPPDMNPNQLIENMGKSESSMSSSSGMVSGNSLSNMGHGNVVGNSNGNSNENSQMLNENLHGNLNGNPQMVMNGNGGVSVRLSLNSSNLNKLNAGSNDSTNRILSRLINGRNASNMSVSSVTSEMEAERIKLSDLLEPAVLKNAFVGSVRYSNGSSYPSIEAIPTDEQLSNLMPPPKLRKRELDCLLRGDGDLEGLRASLEASSGQKRRRLDAMDFDYADTDDPFASFLKEVNNMGNESSSTTSSENGGVSSENGGASSQKTEEDILQDKLLKEIRLIRGVYGEEATTGSNSSFGSRKTKSANYSIPNALGFASYHNADILRVYEAIKIQTPSTDLKKKYWKAQVLRGEYVAAIFLDELIESRRKEELRQIKGIVESKAVLESKAFVKPTRLESTKGTIESKSKRLESIVGKDELSSSSQKAAHNQSKRKEGTEQGGFVKAVLNR